VDWTAIIRDYGIFGGMVLFFILTTWQRSSATERFVQGTLVDLIISTNDLNRQHTAALQRLSETISYCPVRSAESLHAMEERLRKWQPEKSE